MTWNEWIAWLDSLSHEVVTPEFGGLCICAAMFIVWTVRQWLQTKDVEEEEVSSTLQPDDDVEYEVLSEEAVRNLHSKAKELEQVGDDMAALTLYTTILYNSAGGEKGVRSGDHRVSALSSISLEALHSAAVLSRKVGRNEQAVRLMQAEKFVIENALVDVVAKGKVGGPTLAAVVSSALGKDSTTMVDQRCQNFCNLSRIFLAKGDGMMALNYAIKAFALRQKARGLKTAHPNSLAGIKELLSGGQVGDGPPTEEHTNLLQCYNTVATSHLQHLHLN